jgi:hypothetical protein
MGQEEEETKLMPSAVVVFSWELVLKATTSRHAAGEPEEEGATSATTSATALRAATGGPGVVACDEELVVEGACRPTGGRLWQRT